MQDMCISVKSIKNHANRRYGLYHMRRFVVQPYFSNGNLWIWHPKSKSAIHVVRLTKAAKRREEKKAEEEKAAERLAERKEQTEKLEEGRETGTFTVSATGTDVKSVTQSLINTSSGTSTAGSFDIKA